MTDSKSQVQSLAIGRLGRQVSDFHLGRQNSLCRKLVRLGIWDGRVNGKYLLHSRRKEIIKMMAEITDMDNLL